METENYDSISVILGDETQSREIPLVETKQNSIDDENIFYDIENTQINDEYTFLLEPANCPKDEDDNVFADQEDFDDNASEIIELKTDHILSLSQTENQSSELIADVSNSNEMISDIVYDLVDKVDKENQTKNISKITIQKKSDSEKLDDANKSSISMEQLNNFDLVNADKLKSNSDENTLSNISLSIIDLGHKPKPNLLRRRRQAQSLIGPYSSKQKTQTIAELLNTRNVYDSELSMTQTQDQNDLIIEEPFTQDTKPKKENLRKRIRKKTCVLMVKEVHTIYYHEFLDSNNNVVKTQQIDEVKTRDVLEKLEKDKIVNKKSQRELSSSSSVNLVSSDEDKQKHKKTHKIALSNRYQSKEMSPSEPEGLGLRNRKVKPVQKKPVTKSPRTAFNFSNLRFKLTPEERKKDLLELKNSTPHEDEESPRNDIDNFLVEFSQEIENNHVVTPVKEQTKLKIDDKCQVKIERLPQSEFEFYYEKYKNDLQKPATKFKIGDRVYIRANERDIYLPAYITGIKSMSKRVSASFFTFKCPPTDIYYLYECKTYDKNNLAKCFDDEYLKEDSIVKYDFLKMDDEILVWNQKKNQYTPAVFLNYDTRINKDTHVSDFSIKVCRSRFKKIVPFHMTALQSAQVEKIQTRLTGPKQEQSPPKKTKKFSYVNKLNDSDIIEEINESESNESIHKKKPQSDTEYINEEEQDENEEEIDKEELRRTKRRRHGSTRFTSRKRSKPRSSITINKVVNKNLNEPIQSIQETVLQWNRSDSQSSLLSDSSLDLTVCRAASLNIVQTPVIKDTKPETVTRTLKRKSN